MRLSILKKKKKGSFKDPLKRLANMYKVQAQSSAETLLEFNQGQMYCQTFLAIVGVIWILCSFRCILRKDFSQQLCVLRCRRQHLKAVKQRENSRFSFIGTTISNSLKVPRTKYLGGDIHQLSHGSEYNMTSVFRVFHILQTYLLIK